MKSYELKISTISKGFIGYKGADYKVWSSQRYKSNSTNNQDWSGLYIAESEDTAQGYFPSMVEKTGGRGEVYIHRVSLIKDLKVIVCLDNDFKTGKIEMKALKNSIRNKGIDVKDGDLLMKKLGELGYSFRCYNNEEGDIEIIIPNKLSDIVSMHKYKQCSVKNYEVTSCKKI